MRLSRITRERIGAAVGALAILTLFGGVGGLGLWATTSSIYDGLRARDWVPVEAQVTHVDTGTATFVYEFNERKHAGDRVGTFPLGGSTDLDDWEERMDARLSDAIGNKGLVTVFVNPANPAEAMLDREIRWLFVLVITGVALAFTAGGLFAAVAIGRQAFGWEASGAGVPWLKPRAREALFQWGVGLVWNLVMLPAALIGIPRLWESGEYLAVGIVGILAAFGLLILWSALHSTAAVLREGSPFNARTAS